MQLAVERTPPSLLDRMVLKVARSHARRAFDQFMRAAQRGQRTQDRVLIDKVRRCATSAYGRDFGFGNIRSYEDFAHQVPIQRYEDFAPYIERVKRGELRAMFGPSEKVHMFALTSGTATEPKYIPVTGSFLEEYQRGWNAFGVRALLDHRGTFLRPILQISSPMDEFRTEAGIPCGAITGLMAATQKPLVRKYYVGPMSVAYIPETQAKYYTLLRLGMPKDVSWIVTASPATQLQLARTADEFRDDLIRDIHDGTLTLRWDIPGKVREDLADRIQPCPQAAKRLEKIIETTGTLRPKHFWRIGLLCNWTGGTMGLYLRDFPEYFGDTPVRDVGLLATEGRMAVPVEDHTPGGILEVQSQFYEFIPKNEWPSENPVTLRSHEVEVGQEYFLLLTTSSGLYRYDIGDMVRVCAFIADTPVIEFINRGTHVSSLSGEKLTENQVVLAMDALCRSRGWSISNFVMTPTWGEPPCYTVHLDQPPGGRDDDLRNLAAGLDEALNAVNIEYASKRKTHRLGQVRSQLLPEGSLGRLDDRLRSKARRGNEQYKHRFLYTHPEAADELFPGTSADKVSGRNELSQST